MLESKRLKRRRQVLSPSGFTIVELLVVIVVIGILAAITIVSYTGISQRSRDASRSSDATSIQRAIDLYYVDNGSYPSIGSDNVGYDISLLATPLAKYITKIPVDPTGNNYQYVRGPVGNNSYGILIHYESKSACRFGVNDSTTNWWGVSDC